MFRHIALLLAAAVVAVPSVAHAAPDARGTRVINQFLAMYDRMNALDGQVEVDTRKGSETSHMKARLSFQKPHHIAITVIDYPRLPITDGSKITWVGGDRKAMVHTRFFGMPLTLPMPLTDSRMCDIRGDSLKDCSIVTAVEMMRAPGAQFRFLGEGTYRNRPVYRVEMRSPKLLHGIEREVLALDQKTMFPLVRDMYEHGQIVYHFTFDQWRLNPALPSSTFTQL